MISRRRSLVRVRGATYAAEDWVPPVAQVLGARRNDTIEFCGVPLIAWKEALGADVVHRAGPTRLCYNLAAKR